MKKRLVILLTLLFLASTRTIGHAEDRALLIGIDTYKHNEEGLSDTPGCVDDVITMEELLRAKFNFPASSIKTLKNSQATSQRIKDEFNSWLIQGTGPGDRVFFLYSGHGSQLDDDNGDEKTDQMDDTIVTWDGNPYTGENEIRDDYIEGLIRQLSGRRAVLVFDSCYSGTISRAASPRGRFLLPPKLFISPPSRGGNKIFRGGVIGRGVGVKTVDGMSVSVSGVVIISAAKENQESFPIMTNGKFQGALTYVLSEILKNNEMSVASLRDEIKRRLLKLREDKKLLRDQEPVVVTEQSSEIENYPLFGAWTQAVAVAMVNPASDIKVSVRTRDGKPEYKIGENISYQITSSDPGYLYLFVFSEKGIATCIFPNDADRNNKIEAGTINIPRSKDYEFPVQEPIGRDVVIALVSTTQLNLGERVEYQWAEIFDRLNMKLLQDALSGGKGVGVKTLKDLGTWQAAKTEIVTMK